MEKRKLGKSTIEITPIGLGVWQFSEATGFHKLFWSKIEPAIRDQIVQKAIDVGINWFDTAEVYGNGRSERGLAAALQNNNIKDEDIVMATKWRPHLRFAGSITRTFTDREENLAPYSIDLHQIHHPYSFSKTTTEMKKMAELQKNDKIKAIGVSNFSADRMETAVAAAEDFGGQMVSNQVKYSLFERQIEFNGILDRAKELGVTIIAYSPLEQGLSTGIFHESPEKISNLPFIRRRTFKKLVEKTQGEMEALKQIATNYDCSIAQLSLNWLISYHGDTVVAIPGASKVHQVEQNAGSMNFTLSSSDAKEIDELTQAFQR